MPIRRLHVTGVVQGVGFRPFVYQIATRLQLNGWIANTSAGVDIEVEGTESALDAFSHTLSTEHPPLARIDSVSIQEIPADSNPRLGAFEIRASVPLEGAFQPISPDISICPDCLCELLDPTNRRYRYPFINCTNCGPRFTIIEDIPYDRPQTTMRAFPMCDDCAREYHDPTNRRFHAQPIACPACGPQVVLVPSSRFQVSSFKLDSAAESDAWNLEPETPLRVAGSATWNLKLETRGDEAIRAARALLAQGRIIAVKGLGGFHLACDAANVAAVSELRVRKRRIDKPFALMMPDLATVEEHCFMDSAERALLESRERPIVLLRRRPNSDIVREVAPGQDWLGVMLPYTPLHYLLLEPQAGFPRALVMTSGNVSEEPIATNNAEALQRLADLADYFLMHDRDIHIRTDDSVVRVFQGHTYPVRRSRGYAPLTIPLPSDSPPLLATGAELKNTFCLTRERYAFMSHHIGDLENYETLQSFETGISHFERLFRIHPLAIAFDLHPDYLATRYALERVQREGLPGLGVQHHHAHIAACMADNGLSGEHPVIGVAFDGSGYGHDGAIWGGEFLIADYAGYRRAFHLAYVPLPGGDKAVREPRRMALAWLAQAGIEWMDSLPPVRAASESDRRVIRNQIEHHLNAPRTSSMGRLFDAVAALAGMRQVVNYEAQAAIELEARADPHETRAYDFEIWEDVIDAAPAIRAIVADLNAAETLETISARFHNGVAGMVRRVCRLARERFDVNEVALSGGVWQNTTLLFKTVEGLRNDGFTAYLHRQAPTNDGGLALGQAMVAAHRIGQT